MGRKAHNAKGHIHLGTCSISRNFNPLNAELSPIRHLLALVGARHIVHVRRERVKDNTFGLHFRQIFCLM